MNPLVTGVKLTLRELKSVIREEVFSTWMRTAGWCAGGSGISLNPSVTGVNAPPGLGDDDGSEDAVEDDEAERKGQLAVRYRDRGSIMNNHQRTKNMALIQQEAGHSPRHTYTRLKATATARARTNFTHGNYRSDGSEYTK